jgi:hypothetical protein
MGVLASAAFDRKFDASNPAVEKARLARRDDKSKAKIYSIGLSLVPTIRNKVFIGKDSL